MTVRYYDYDLFVSYCHSDSKGVLTVVKRLASRGIDAFLDIWALNLGDSLIATIENSLSRSRAGLIFFSKNALSSPWVKEEYEMMSNRTIKDPKFKFIGVKLDNSEIPPFAKTHVYFELYNAADIRSTENLVNEILKSLGKEHNKESDPHFAEAWELAMQMYTDLRLRLRGLRLTENSNRDIWLILDSLIQAKCRIRIINKKCDCGGVVICGYVDLGGGLDYRDSYFHICTHCYQHSYAQDCGHTGDEMDNQLPMCPWCQHRWYT